MRKPQFEKLVELLGPEVEKLRGSPLSDDELTRRLATTMLTHPDLHLKFKRCKHPTLRLTGNYRTEVLFCRKCGYSLLDK